MQFNKTRQYSILYYSVFLLCISAYNEKVVLFLRQANIDEMLKERFPQYSSNNLLKDKIHKIRSHGTDALDRLSNDIDLTILLRFVQYSLILFCDT